MWVCYLDNLEIVRIMELEKIPCFQTFSLKRDKYIFVGSKQEIIDSSDLYDGILGISLFCKTPKSIDEIKKFLIENNLSEDSYNFAVEKNILIKNHIDLEDRYSRNDNYLEYQGINSQLFKSQISKMNIFIVGCGGIGNIISYMLVSLGALKLTLIDDDIIEESNLNRQFLFDETDLAKKKVVVLKEKLMKINSNLNISTVDINVESFNQNLAFENSSFIILSADSKNSLKVVTESATLYHIPMLNVGYLNDISCIGPFYIPKKSSCPMCQNIYGNDDQTENEHAIDINNYYKAPSAPMNNFIASTMAINDIINYISDNWGKIKSFNRRYGINSFTFEHDYIDVPMNTNCNYCAYTSNSVVSS